MQRVPLFYVLQGVIALWGGFLSAQNLLMNPSFETFRQCPDRLGNFHADVAQWSSPTDASTDYFNACSPAMGTPENFNGTQPAEFGDGYAGLYLYAPNDYREYVQGELQQTLKKGEVYTLSFYVSLAERSDYAVREFTAVFSRKKLRRPIKKELSRTQLYKEEGNAFTMVEIAHSDFYDETTDWVELRAEFTASGMENFVTIGNFRNNARTRTYKTSRNAKQGAYYYLDMVRLLPLQPDGANPETYALHTQHLFRNVLFGFDEHRLGPEARLELRKLYEYLQAHADLQITINGHTDNLGPAAYNRRLSEQRCKSVTAYLLSLGLNRERIHWVSYGFDAPIADNATEEGRQKNRRVAFTLAKTPEE